MAKFTKLHTMAKAYLDMQNDVDKFRQTLAGQPTAPGDVDLKQAPCDHLVQHIAEVLSHTTPSTNDLVRQLVCDSADLDWWNAYTANDPAGLGFFDKTAGTLLAGPGGVFTTDHGLSGFFYLRDGVEYASHKHEPDEIYFILAGQAQLWNSDTGWAIAGVGDIIHTPSNSWHAMKTGRGPVLILCVGLGRI